MSDNSIPTPSGGPQPTPPPPAAPAPPAQPYQAASPAAQPPSYPTAPPASPTQAYPGAAPSFAPSQPVHDGGSMHPYGSAPAASPYPTSAPGQPATGYPNYAAPNYTAPNYPAPRPASGLAVTSLICGIAGVVLFWAVVPLLASIVAVITGHMALRQTKANPSIGGRGMAFAGLIMGYIMVAVLVIGIVMTVIGFLFFGAFTLPFLFST
ncbi:DUF4190 domain-containing protein [Microbacterium sp. CFBP9023]|uniref:DUF4190 domain-containing protein n=1 Tax=Microbacterium sp. CFBP9023 TaxID=3096535 RepID=UPI002A6B2083|nr:DUF4190 domain-containing protein [Microbacterium sp. CFBP9023]MDY0983044.1 DUF4190 domain-containing protein [Microbacterium sp. CFBP9023]